MSELKKIQLEILEAIEGIPEPLTPIPMAFEDTNGKVQIPGAVMERLREQGIKVKLDENGKIGANEYCKLLTVNNLGIDEIRLITFKKMPKVDVKSINYKF